MDHEFTFTTERKAQAFERWFDRNIGTECERTDETVLCVEMTRSELAKAKTEAAEIERLG